MARERTAESQVVTPKLLNQYKHVHFKYIPFKRKEFLGCEQPYRDVFQRFLVAIRIKCPPASRGYGSGSAS